MVEAFIDLPIDSAEPWRLVDAQALDRPVTFWPREATITGVIRTGRSARRIPDPRRGAARHPRHEPLRNTLGAERPPAAPALVGAVAAAMWLCGLRSRRRRPADTLQRRAGGSSAAARRFAENERIKMSVGDDGTFEVTDKATGVTYHRVAAIEDVGDVGDEYNYSPPASDRRVTSADARVTASRASAAVRCAPACASSSSCRCRDRPAPIARAARLKRVTVPVTIDATLDAGSPRVAFAVSVDNRASDHRLRLLFPTGAASVDDRPRRHRVRRHHPTGARSGARHDPQRVAGQQHADDLDGGRRRRRNRRDRDRQGADGIRDRRGATTIQRGATAEDAEENQTGSAVSASSALIVGPCDRDDADPRGRRSVAQRSRDAAVRPRRSARRHAGGAVPRDPAVRARVRAARHRRRWPAS